MKRDKEKIGLKWPLAKVIVSCNEEIKKFAEIIKSQLNVKNVKFKKAEKINLEFDFKITPELESPPNIVGQAWKDVPATPVAKMFMAHFAEVEVDTETGEIKILKVAAVHDSGRIINPEVCENQVSGGVILGYGFAVTEELIFDEKTGVVLNSNYTDYKIPTALDTMPIAISFADVIDPVGPFGAKGIGEGAACPVAPAIAQAIYNAIGIRFTELPITPEKVLKALKEGKREYP